MKTIHLLLADDHAIIRDGLKQIFADTDDIVVAGEAADGNAVLGKVHERDWDLLLLDLSMPGRSGFDLIRQIKHLKPELPILVLSMHAEDQYALRTLKAGASGYLNKECDSALLIAVIRKVAAGGIYVSAAIAENVVRDRMQDARPLPHALLSEREYEIFMMILAGKSLTAIGDTLSLSVKTVSTHKTHILQKMGMTSTVELVRYGITHHLADSDRP